MTPEMLHTIAQGSLDGLSVGIAPLLIGVYNNRLSLALQGLLGTILLGIYAGLLLAVPGAVYSTWRIVHDSIVAADSLDIPTHPRMLRN